MNIQEKLNIIDLDDIVINYSIKEYNKYYNNLLNKLLKNFKSTIRYPIYKEEELIKSPYLKDAIITVNFKYNSYDMTYGNLLSLLIIFKLLNKLINENQIELDTVEDYIFEPDNPNSFNEVLDILYYDLIDIDNIKELIFDRISELSKISGYFVSGTVNLYDICKLRKNSKEFKDITNFKLDTTLSKAEQISSINKNRSKLEEILKEMDTCYRPLIKSKAGINMKQLSQIINCIGPKPDTFGNIFPDSIESNFVNGLRNRMDFFINADNARKSLITNFVNVKQSGL